MTDEEQAMTQFKNTFCTTCEDREICDISILDCTAYDSIYKQAYLAGLKAGRPKWHKVADGDLPKNRRNVYVVYMNGHYEMEKTIASFRHKFWVFDGHKTECEVIAWCEIPKYKE